MKSFKNARSFCLRKKIRNFTSVALVLTIFLLITPIALAKSRKVYLTDFILKNKINNEGFANSLEATSYSLEILKYYDMLAVKGLFGTTNPNVNSSILQKNLESNINSKFGNNSVNIYDIYFFIKSSKTLNSSINPYLLEKIRNYIAATRSGGGGFCPTNTSESVSLSSTYFAIKTISLLNDTVLNVNGHKNLVYSCRNSDGGYGGNSTLPSTIVDTYFAVSIINELGKVNELVSPNRTIEYLNSSYCADESDKINYGGYLPDQNAKYALIYSTYYCVQAISLLNPNKLNFTRESTINWVLVRQNFQDGGFIDSSAGTRQTNSSIQCSYFAFETLKTLDKSLFQLNEDVFMVEFNYWILIVILSSVGLAVAILIFIWRSRRI